MDVLRDHWLLGVVGAGIVFAIAFALTEDAAVARKVFLRFVFTVALPLVFILGGPLVLIASTFAIPDAVWPALIAGSVIAGGWLTTTMFAELARAQQKAERLRDVHKALFAEIRNTLSALYGTGRFENDAADIVRRMEEDEQFLPFLPRERHDFIYSQIVTNIEILPRVTIDPIVAYYGYVLSMNAQADDMRSPEFAKLPQPRRILAYKDYIETRERVFRAGEHTLGLIRAFSEGGSHAAEAYIRRLNSPDAVQSDPAAGRG